MTAPHVLGVTHHIWGVFFLLWEYFFYYGGYFPMMGGIFLLCGALVRLYHCMHAWSPWTEFFANRSVVHARMFA